MNKELRECAMTAVRTATARATKDPTRPVFHFRPPAQWMNDVCGGFHYDGHYHIFFQFHPWSDQCGRESTGEGVGWGHARSDDLMRWEFLAPALLPSPEMGERSAASGSAYVRPDGVPMLFFTHTPIEFPQKPRAAWAAVPADRDLVDWQRVDIGLSPGQSGVPSDISPRWADMFVFRIGDRVFATFKESNGLVCEAVNDQLTGWRAIGHLGGDGPEGTVQSNGIAGECPNLFALRNRHVLIRSTYPISYTIGSFDPDSVTFQTESGPHVLDHGYGGNSMPDRHSRGLYGTTVFHDQTGRLVLVGWVSGFSPHRGWNGCMCLPRILSIHDDRLIQTPLPEARNLRANHTHVEHVALTDEMKEIEGARGDTLELIAKFSQGSAAAFGLKVRCSVDGTRSLVIRYSDQVLSVAGTEVPLDLTEEAGTLKLQIFLDRSVMELFGQDGSVSVTRVNYPKDEDQYVFAFAEGGTAILESLDVWEMDSVW